MSQAAWIALAKIAQAKFERDVRAYREVQGELGMLYAKRDQLNQMRHTAREGLRETLDAQKHNGDVQWQKWVSRNLRELNMAEAKLRAQREQVLPLAQKSFGQKVVCEKLRDSAKKR